MFQRFEVDRNLQRAPFVNIFFARTFGKLVVVSNQRLIPGDVHAINLPADRQQGAHLVAAACELALYECDDFSVTTVEIACL